MVSASDRSSVMRRLAVGVLALTLALAGCDDDVIFVGGVPAAPQDVAASYYGGVVTVTWALASDWNGEPFRVYSRRITDSDYFFIAEVTNCAGGFCEYDDINIVSGETYEYYVAAVDPDSGLETASDFSVTVLVPAAVAPPAPNGVLVVALDNANFIQWGDGARQATDFSFYRVYQQGADNEEFLLGETDSEGFLDLLAANGDSYAYFVTAVDSDGHESAASAVAWGTPRPDFHGEWVWDHFARPADSGFRFQSSDGANPIVMGNSSLRHFRLEVDSFGFWLVPGPDAAVYPVGFATTALKCQVGADDNCSDVSTAPTSGYVGQDMQLESQTSYVLRVLGDDGEVHYAVIRVGMLGYDQNDDGIMIFDWAYQLQAGNPDLISGR